jgi:hypothetical protein
VPDHAAGVGQPPAGRISRLSRSLPAAFAAGSVVGVLGGMIGLGDAEFRLPLLIGLFGFLALQAVILNKAMSLIVVITALPVRLTSVQYNELIPHWPIVAVSSSAACSAHGPGPAGRPRCVRHRCTRRWRSSWYSSHRIALSLSHFGHLGALQAAPLTRAIAAMIAGFGFGVVAALIGGRRRASHPDDRDAVRRRHQDRRQRGAGGVAPDDAGRIRPLQPREELQCAPRDGRFVVAMAAGSVVGTVVGGLVLGVTPTAVLIPLLVLLLLFCGQSMGARLNWAGSRFPATLGVASGTQVRV